MIPVEGSMIASWGLYVLTCSRPYTVGHWFQIGKEVVEGIKKHQNFHTITLELPCLMR
jgi:hypothetical protein